MSDGEPREFVAGQDEILASLSGKTKTKHGTQMTDAIGVWHCLHAAKTDVGNTVYWMSKPARSSGHLSWPQNRKRLGGFRARSGEAKPVIASITDIFCTRLATACGCGTRQSGGGHGQLVNVDCSSPP
jgi:hypothetical protein